MCIRDSFSIAPRLDQPIFGIAIGVLIGGGLQVLLQVPSLKNTGQSLKPVFSLNDPKIRKLLKLLGPTLLGAGVYQINIILLRNLASFLPEGQVTHYYNASRLSGVVLGVFAFGFVFFCLLLCSFAFPKTCAPASVCVICLFPAFYDLSSFVFICLRNAY